MYAVKRLKDGREGVNVDAQSEILIFHGNQKLTKTSGNEGIGKKKIQKGKVHIVSTEQIPMGTVYEIFTQTLDTGRFLLVGYLILLTE